MILTLVNALHPQGKNARTCWHIAWFCVIGWMALGLPGAGGAETKVLFIGNSFTFADGDKGVDLARSVGGVPEIFCRLAQAGGQGCPAVVKQAVAGKDFRFHCTNVTTQTLLKSQPWTYVVLQNYSTEPTHLVDGSHCISNHLNYGQRLCLQILSNCPRTQVVLEETWSRAAAHRLISGVSGPRSFASTAEMQEELRTNYLRLANVMNCANAAGPRVLIAPVGDAWQKMGGLMPEKSPSFVSLFKSDHYHGNDNGYYLAAAVIYSRIYGVSPHGLFCQPQVAALKLHLTVSPAALEDVAWNTVSAANESGAQSGLPEGKGTRAAAGGAAAAQDTGAVN